MRGDGEAVDLVPHALHQLQHGAAAVKSDRIVEPVREEDQLLALRQRHEGQLHLELRQRPHGELQLHGATVDQRHLGHGLRVVQDVPIAAAHRLLDGGEVVNLPLRQAAYPEATVEGGVGPPLLEHHAAAVGVVPRRVRDVEGVHPPGDGPEAERPLRLVQDVPRLAVQVLLQRRGHALARDAPEGAHRVAAMGRLLEVHSARGGVHAPVQALDQLPGVPLQQEDDVPHSLAVLRLRAEPGAGPHGVPQAVLDAGALPRVRFEVRPADAQGEVPLRQAHEGADVPSADEGAQVDGAVVALDAGDLEAREGLVRHADVGVPVVHLEVHVEEGGVSADQPGLDDQGLRLRLRADDGDVLHQRNQLAQPRRGEVGMAEVGGHAAAQLDGLPHVDHRAPGVAHDVDAGPLRQAPQDRGDLLLDGAALPCTVFGAGTGDVPLPPRPLLLRHGAISHGKALPGDSRPTSSPAYRSRRYRPEIHPSIPLSVLTWYHTPSAAVRDSVASTRSPRDIRART